MTKKVKTVRMEVKPEVSQKVMAVVRGIVRWGEVLWVALVPWEATVPWRAAVRLASNQVNKGTF